MRNTVPASNLSRLSGRAIVTAIVMPVLVACLVGSVGPVAAQQVDLPRTAQGTASVEVLELRAALQVVQKQLDEEKSKTAEAAHQRKVMAQSLAAANAEAEAHRDSYRDLLLKLEGLGVDILDPDPKGLQSRLLKAVRDRDLLERELDGITEQLFKLTEVFVAYMQSATSDDAEARQAIESELLATSKVFEQGRNAEASGKVRAIAEGRVVSLDPEIGLVVLNIGRDSGVRVGMPLELMRVDRPIGNALVVDVRDSICGAVINELMMDSGDDVKVGDRVRPQAADSL